MVPRQEEEVMTEVVAYVNSAPSKFFAALWVGLIPLAVLGAIMAEKWRIRRKEAKP